MLACGDIDNPEASGSFRPRQAANPLPRLAPCMPDDCSNRDGGYDIVRVRTKVAELADRLRGIMEARHEAETRFHSESRQAEELLKGSLARVKEKRDTDMQGIGAHRAEEIERIEGEYERGLARVQANHDRDLSEVEDGARQRLAALAAQSRESKGRVVKERDERRAAAEEEFAGKVERIQSLRADADALGERIRRFAALYKVRLGDAPGTEPRGWRSKGFQGGVEIAKAELVDTGAALHLL